MRTHASRSKKPTLHILPKSQEVAKIQSMEVPSTQAKSNEEGLAEWEAQRQKWARFGSPWMDKAPNPSGDLVQPWIQRKQQLGNLPDRSEQVPEKDRFQKLDATQLQHENPPRENRTGMPDQLKLGLEKLSGLDLSGVRVHRNSAKPAQLSALAYAQGQNIHLGPRQEQQLPHEGWHVVQQMQGRVKPTIHAKGVSINDDVALEREAEMMGAKALQRVEAQQTTDNILTQEKLMVSDQSPVQRYLKVGPIVVQEEHVQFIYKKICQEAINILSMWEGAEEGPKNSPTWVAYQKKIPFALLNQEKKIKGIITRWAKSSGVGLPTIKESVKERITKKRGEKAEWKEFGDFLELALAIGYELDPDLQDNKEFEAELGTQILKNEEVAQKLDVMRLKVMHWIVRQYQKDESLFAGFKMKFKLGGSYNFSSRSKVQRNFDVLLKTKGLSVMDNIEILHDLMELTSDKGAGSFFQKFGKVLAPEVRESAYYQVGISKNGELYEMRPMKTKSDHGPGGSAWKASKHYTLKIFDVEYKVFTEQMVVKKLDEFEMVDLANPVDDELDVKSKELTTRYSEKRSKKMDKAMKYQRREAQNTWERLRDTILMGLELKAKFKPANQDTLHKRSKGRHNVGTRDEYDPVTVLARANNVPIEAGRSMTTARMLELCNKVLNEDPEGRELHELGRSELDAVAQGIFAYWAAQYNQALTPIHTYHEIMGVARQYGVEYTPFHYKVLDKITMEAKKQVSMNTEAKFKIPKEKWNLKEERRELPYRPTDAQRDKLLHLKREAVWISPNGDCLYNALAAMGASIGNVSKFREELATFLIKKQEEYREFMDSTTPEEVAKQIAKPGSYFNLGGDMTPLLIANYLGMPFTILNADGTYTHIKGGDLRHLVIRVTNPLPHFHSTRATKTEENIELSNL